MLHRFILSRFSHYRYLSTTVNTSWREKLSQGPSLKSFIQQTVNQIPIEPILPSYLTQNKLDDYFWIIMVVMNVLIMGLMLILFCK